MHISLSAFLCVGISSQCFFLICEKMKCLLDTFGRVGARFGEGEEFGESFIDESKM